MRKGFAILEILIALVVVAIIAGGSFYLGKKNLITPQTGENDVKQAEEVAQLAASSSAAEQQEIDATQQSSQTATSGTALPAKTTTGTTVASDPFAGLGGDKYANGNLPLGDGKYVTDGPKKGYVYLCRAMQGGGGAQQDGSWIQGSSWNINQKMSVQGSVSWPNAAVTISIKNSTRAIVSNGLPSGAVTGIFPIQSTDPAYAYDKNPNSIKVQQLSFSLPASPVAAAAPSCIGGEIGIMTNGVPLFDAFDAELRDAVAHEVQDKCDGHPQEAGEYHYHGPSACLSNDVKTVIGYGYDGFPITGAVISSGRYLTTSDLDVCHGITSPIVLDGKTVTMYHYVMTKDFPYSVSCFHGTPAFTGPTAGQNQTQTQTQTQTGGAPQPPAAAISACSGKSNGNSCSFATPQGAISGTCATPPGQTQLACVPAK